MKKPAVNWDAVLYKTLRPYVKEHRSPCNILLRHIVTRSLASQEQPRKRQL
jgi:hypothetical protein